MYFALFTTTIREGIPILRSMNAVNPVQTKEELICRAVARHYRLGKQGTGAAPRAGLMSSYVDAITNEIVLVSLDGKTARYAIDSFR
jgi:uncharacterized protein YbaR (Trm112 family)